MELEVCVTCATPPPPRLGPGAAWSPSALVWTDAHHGVQVQLGGPRKSARHAKTDEGGVRVQLELDPVTRAILPRAYRVKVRHASMVVVGLCLGAVSDEGSSRVTGNVICTFVAHVADLRQHGEVTGSAEAPEASDFAGATVTLRPVSPETLFGSFYVYDRIERALASVGNKAVSVGAELAFKSTPLPYPGRTAGMKSLDTRFLNGSRAKGLPAWIIMTCAPENPEAPEFVEYILRIAAKRRGISEESLLRLARAASADILRTSKTSGPASETILFATLVGEAVREVVAFFPYVTDMVDGNSGTSWSPSRVHPYEFFSSALRVAGGGDCEDKAREVCEIYRGIMRMTFDPEQHEVAGAAWAVSRCSVPLMVLGEVESRAVTDYDRERTKQYLVAEDPNSPVRHNAHCYNFVIGTNALARIAARCPQMHAENAVVLDGRTVLDPWDTSLPPLLLDGTTGGVDLYPALGDLRARGCHDPEVAPYDAFESAWLTGRLDAKYYYTARNCFVPYGLVCGGNNAYEIYWYSETPEGTRHASLIDCFYAEPHAAHPDCPGGIKNVGNESVWIAASVAPTAEQLRDMLPLTTRLQPVPAYPLPPSGMHRSAVESVARLRIQTHVSRAPPRPRCVAAVRAEFVSGSVHTDRAAYFDVHEFMPGQPVIHVYVDREES